MNSQSRILKVSKFRDQNRNYCWSLDFFIVLLSGVLFITDEKWYLFVFSRKSPSKIWAYLFKCSNFQEFHLHWCLMPMPLFKRRDGTPSGASTAAGGMLPSIRDRYEFREVLGTGAFSKVRFEDYRFLNLTLSFTKYTYFWRWMRDHVHFLIHLITTRGFQRYFDEKLQLWKTLLKFVEFIEIIKKMVDILYHVASG